MVISFQLSEQSITVCFGRGNFLSVLQNREGQMINFPCKGRDLVHRSLSFMVFASVNTGIGGLQADDIIASLHAHPLHEMGLYLPVKVQADTKAQLIVVERTPELTVVGGGAPDKTYHPIPLPAPDVAIWDQAVAASIKMPGYHHKRERRITRGPVLPYPIAKLGAMTANIPDGKPNVISAERELTIPVNKAASALWFVGQATMGKGYPINGTNGHEYGSYVITYSDGTEEVLPLRDGVESATVFGLIGPTAFDPRAAKTSRAFTIDYDRNWEVYHAGLLRIPTASKVISSVTVRITDENYYLLLYGVTVEE